MVKPKVKPPNKKLLIPLAVVGILGVVLLLRRKSQSPNATEPGAEGLSNQSFIPVTGQNVAGAGAGNYGGGEAASLFGQLITSDKEAQKEQNLAFENYMREQSLANKESMQSQQNFTRELLANLGTGGGAPVTGAPGGAVAAPPSPSAPATPAPPAPAAKECAPGFPFKGPHGCYRWSRTKSSDGCPCHGYQSGLLVCQHKKNGACSF